MYSISHEAMDKQVKPSTFSLKSILQLGQYFHCKLKFDLQDPAGTPVTLSGGANPRDLRLRPCLRHSVFSWKVKALVPFGLPVCTRTP